MKFVYSIAPSCFLIRVVFDADLTREQRLDLLGLVFGILMAQYLCTVAPEKSDPKISDHNARDCDIMNLWQKDWLEKGIHLCASLASILCDSRAVNLGALGSHILEHFFGFVRRVCQGNNEKEAFLRAVTEFIDMKSLTKELSDPTISQRRISDSGVMIPESDHRVASSHRIGWFLAIGYQMMRIASGVNIGFPKCILRSDQFAASVFGTISDVLAYLKIPAGNEKQKNPSSLKQSKVTCGSGLLNAKKNAEIADLRNLSTKQ